MLILHLDFNTIQMKKETVPDCLRTAAFYSQEQPRVSATDAAAIAWSVRFAPDRFVTSDETSLLLKGAFGYYVQDGGK